MTPELKLHFRSELAEIYDARELDNMWRVLKEDLFYNEGYDRLDNIIDQLKDHVPVQYITGVEYFFGYKFKVSPDVLIPRPETEELVDWVLTTHSDQEYTVLDIGTGSGCAACALKLTRPDWLVKGMDISENAIEVAKENGTLLHADVHFFVGDMCRKKDYPTQVNIILCNPPYVLRSDLSIMTMSVDRYEPHIALYSPDQDPLYFYRAVLEAVVELYDSGTELFFEMHHHYVKDLISLCQEFDMKSIEVRNDLEGLPRMLRCRRS